MLNEDDLEKIKRVAILSYNNFNCVYCGLEATTIDHIVPQSRGGTDDLTNLVACCNKCNCSKNASPLPNEAMKRVLCYAWVSEPEIKRLFISMVGSEVTARERKAFFKTLEKPYLHPI
jgi:hypothetical protein